MHATTELSEALALLERAIPAAEASLADLARRASNPAMMGSLGDQVRLLRSEASRLRDELVALRTAESVR